MTILTVPGYCSSDSECRLTQACIENRCSNPCTVVPPPCGVSAHCRVINHRTLCQCLDGYDGDPRVECRQGNRYWGQEDFLNVLGCGSSNCRPLLRDINCYHTNVSKNVFRIKKINHNFIVDYKINSFY